MRNRSLILPTLSLSFGLPLRPTGVRAWRGAVAASAGRRLEEFHNHDNAAEKEGALHNRYPQIQYRCSGGKAGIWACGPAVESVRNWVAATDLTKFQLNGKNRPLTMTEYADRPFTLQQEREPRHYRLLDWLALNQENYARWRALPTLHQRIDLLEEILTGQLLGFAAACGWHLPDKFRAELVNLSSMRTEKVHGGKRIAFNVIYRVPLILPPGLALGRSVAFGFGVQRPLGSPPPGR